MTDEPRRAPIEITIKVDPAALPNVGAAVSRRAKAAAGVLTSRPAIQCYWIAAVAAALLVLVALAASGIVSGAVLGRVLAVGILSGVFGGLIALKRKYSPLIPD